MFKVRLSRVILALVLGLSFQGLSAGTVHFKTLPNPGDGGGGGATCQDDCITGLQICYAAAMSTPDGDPEQCYVEFNLCINTCPPQ